MSEKLSRKISKADIEKFLIKVGDILDRIEETELADYADDLSSYVASLDDDQRLIEIEVPEDEQDLMAELYESLITSLLERG